MKPEEKLGQRGQRLITREAFYGMVEQALVIDILPILEKKDIEYSKYTSLPKMDFGASSKDVLKLQEMLIDGGYLSPEIPRINYDSKGNTYGYYGTITNNAVLKWQLENIKSVSQAQLKAWGGKYWGNASNLRVKELATVAGDNPPAQEYMTTKIQFKWDKFLTITGSALLLYIATNINNIEWTKAGLLSAGTALIQFLAQAILKYINEEKG